MGEKPRERSCVFKMCEKLEFLCEFPVLVLLVEFNAPHVLSLCFLKALKAPFLSCISTQPWCVIGCRDSMEWQRFHCVFLWSDTFWIVLLGEGEFKFCSVPYGIALSPEWIGFVHCAAEAFNKRSFVTMVLLRKWAWRFEGFTRVLGCAHHTGLEKTT